MNVASNTILSLITSYELFERAMNKRDMKSDDRVIFAELLLKDDSFYRHNDVLRMACEKGHASVVELLLKDGRADPAAQDNYDIRSASHNGYAAVVGLLLDDERVDPAAQNNQAIILASKNGHATVVELLLKDGRADPTAHDNNAIRLASKNGHSPVVKLLENHRLEEKKLDESQKLEESTASEDNASIKTTRKAMKVNNAKVVEYMYTNKGSELESIKEEIMDWAIENENIDMIKLLLD